MGKRVKATAQSWPHKPMPPEQKKLLIDGVYSSGEFEKIQLGVIPQSKNDKWFIFFEEECLSFHRSHTGSCIYQLQIQKQGETAVAQEIIVNRHPEQYRNQDDHFDVAMVAYLIDTLLLGRFAPLPKPKGLRQQDMTQYKRDMIGKKDDGNFNLNVQNN